MNYEDQLLTVAHDPKTWTLVRVHYEYFSQDWTT